MRAAIAEIAFLALLVLIGTLRGSEVPARLADLLPFTQGFVDRWYSWDVFGSAIFAATLALLAIAIAVCTINRVPGIWQTISEPRIRTSPGYLQAADTSAAFETGSSPQDVAASFEAILSRQRFRVLTQQIGQDIHVYADKNRYAKLGTFPFHLALILLLVGGIVGAQFGFREQEFVVPLGETRDVGHGTGLSVELQGFSESYTPGGFGESYEADIVILENGEPVKTDRISPNHPTSYNSATFYQSSLGYGATMAITSSDGVPLYNGTVDLGIFTYAGNPDAPAGFVTVPGANVRMTVVGPDIEPTAAPELDTLQLLNGQMYVILDKIGGTALDRQAFVIDQGQPVQLGDMTIVFEREIQWSLLQVAYNPGIPIFIIASVFLVGGLIVTFYLPLRRIRGIISPKPGGEGSQLMAVPLAKRDWSGKRDFRTTVEKLEADLGVPATVRMPDSMSDPDG